MVHYERNHQVKMASSREVAKMMSFFLPLLRKDLAEFHLNLNSDFQLHPFESLQNVLAIKLKIGKHIADTQSIMKTSKPVIATSTTSFTIESKQLSLYVRQIDEIGKMF